MISHSHRCIFIHIPKTAGTSIESKLGHFDTLSRGIQDHRTIRQIEPQDPPPHRFAFWKRDPHPPDPASVTPRQYRDYFKFTFVRNPWARAHSWYRNVMDDPRHREKHHVPAECSFSEFMTNHGDQWALRPQTHWILDRHGALPLNFVGRFEQLEEDFLHVCRRLGLADPSLPSLMKAPGQRPSYLDAYDPATRDLVAERYADEIARFGYRYGD